MHYRKFKSQPRPPNLTTLLPSGVEFSGPLFDTSDYIPVHGVTAEWKVQASMECECIYTAPLPSDNLRDRIELLYA